MLESQNTPELAQRIADESQGWPFFVWELAQQVRENPDFANQSLELDEVIWARVQRLPEGAIEFLQLIAVVGRPMPVGEAYQALDVVAEGPGLLAQLRTANFVRTTDSGEGAIVETYHDRVRESVFNHMGDSVVQQLYLRLANHTLETSGLAAEAMTAHIELTPDYEPPADPLSIDKPQWQRVFDVSRFFDSGGDSEQALPFALVAAERAWSRNAFEVAEQYYQIAAGGADRSSNALRFRIAEGLGHVLLMRGKYDASAEQFELARSLAQDNITRARIDAHQGDVRFKEGDIDPRARCRWQVTQGPRLQVKLT